MASKLFLIMESGEKLEIIPDEVFGRDGLGADICMPIDKISRVHAIFTKLNNNWFIEDQNSMNGTFVNGTKLMPYEKVHIINGDVIHFSSKLKVTVKIGAKA